MDATGAAAYITAQAACAIVEAMGMLSVNQMFISRGDTPPYPESSFNGLSEQYSLTHNQVLTYLQGFGG